MDTTFLVVLYYPTPIPFYPGNSSFGAPGSVLFKYFEISKDDNNATFRSIWKDLTPNDTNATFDTYVNGVAPELLPKPNNPIFPSSPRLPDFRYFLSRLIMDLGASAHAD